MKRREFCRSFLGFGSTIVLAGAISSCGVLEAGVYTINQENCDGCGDCVNSCSYGAIELKDDKAAILTSKCEGCGKCKSKCDNGAISEE